MARKKQNKENQMSENQAIDMENMDDLTEVLGGHSLEDIKKGLKMLEQREASTKRRADKIASGEIVIDPEKKKAQQTKQWVKNLLLTRKAKEAGLSVTEEEIDDYIATQKASR